MESSHASQRLDRKTVERNRRNHMKSLYSKLDSLLPNSPHFKEGMTQLDRLDEAVNYIKGLQERLERMKERKWQLMGSEGTNQNMSSHEVVIGLRLPHIEVRDMGSVLGVFLISRASDRFAFHETIRVLEEEGAEVVNANFSVVGDKAFHTIHSLVADPRSSGFGPEKVLERLKKVVHGFANVL